MSGFKKQTQTATSSFGLPKFNIVEEVWVQKMVNIQRRVLNIIQEGWKIIPHDYKKAAQQIAGCVEE